MIAVLILLNCNLFYALALLSVPSLSISLSLSLSFSSSHSLSGNPKEAVLIISVLPVLARLVQPSPKLFIKSECLYEDFGHTQYTKKYT